MAVWSATGGSDEGFEIFDAFSRRWEFGTYDEALTQRCGRRSAARPDIGAGTIFYMADQASPDGATDTGSDMGQDSGDDAGVAKPAPFSNEALSQRAPHSVKS